MKKLYLVYREVLASSIKQAMVAKGRIYSVQLAANEAQPDVAVKKVGFKIKDK